MQAFWRDAVEFLPILMSGVALTIIVTIGSLLLSTVLGLVWAVQMGWVSVRLELENPIRLALRVLSRRCVVTAPCICGGRAFGVGE